MVNQRDTRRLNKLCVREVSSFPFHYFCFHYHERFNFLSLSLHHSCYSLCVTYVFLRNLAREIDMQAPKMNPPCACPTFDRFVGLVCMCNEPAILPPDIVHSVSVAMFV